MTDSLSEYTDGECIEVPCKNCRGQGEHADELKGDRIVMCMECGGTGYIKGKA